MIINNVINRIKDYKNEGYPALNNGFNRLNEYLFGVEQKAFYLLGGRSGTGKTALLDSMFITNPYNFIKSSQNINKYSFKINYYSLEIPSEDKILKFIAKKLYDDYKLFLDVNYLLSKGKNRVSDEIFRRVVETKDYFEELESYLNIQEFGVNPTQIYMDIRNQSLKQGKFFDKNNEQVIINYNDPQNILNEQLKKVYYYKKNNPNEFVIDIVDHIGLFRGEENATSAKEKIDKVAQYFITGRNIYGRTEVMVSQFNRDQQSVGRKNADMLEPQESDFKESSSPFEACNFALATFTPYDFGLNNYQGYNLNILQDKLKVIKILKNRNGPSGGKIGCFFLGKIGEYIELPKPDSSNTSDEYYINLVNRIVDLEKNTSKFL